MHQMPPSLHELALSQCTRYASYIVDIGDLPYAVVKPFLAKLNREQLGSIEEKCPHIKVSSDELWKEILVRDFRDRKLPTTNYREAYQKFHRDKEAQLSAARERLKMKQEQFNRNKRKASVIELSDRDLPISSRSSHPVQTFKSHTMRTVAKQIQSTGLLRKTVVLNNRMASSEGRSLRVNSVAAQTPCTRPKLLRACQESEHQVHSSQLKPSPSPQKKIKSLAILPMQLNEQVNCNVNLKRKRVASVFMPKR